jgi:hypothetical protein
MLRHPDRALNVGSVQERQDALADATGARALRRIAEGPVATQEKAQVKAPVKTPSPIGS